MILTVVSLEAKVKRLEALAAAERERGDNAERRNAETRRDYGELQALYEVAVARANATKAELASAREEIARLKRQAAYYSGWENRMEEIARLKRQAAYYSGWENRMDELHAKLGAAVAALREAHAYLISGNSAPPGLFATIGGILADAESSAAGEAYGELVAVYEAAKAVRDRSSFGPAYRVTDAVLRDALAKVDARRGGGR